MGAADMALNPAIFGMYQPQQIQTPQNALMQGLQLQGAQQGNALTSMKMQAFREQQEQQARSARAAEAQAAAQREALQNLPAPQSSDPRAAMIRQMVQAGLMKPDALKDAYDPNLGRATVKRTVTVAGPDGRPMTVQLDDYGQAVGQGMPEAVKMQLENMGDKSVAVDPYALKPGQTMQRGMSPSERDSSARGWAGIGIQRQAEARQQAAMQPGGGKPLPPGALKMQQESLDAIGISSSIVADMGAVEKQIDEGKLSFGPVSNLYNTGRNLVGRSTEESRNFGTFKSTLERLRNESLRLNAGVQTDGDAQRAWNELFQNINDTGLVKQRLAEIQAINRRGTDLHRLRVDSIRANYGAGNLDSSQYSQQPAAVGAGQQSGAAYDAEKERRYQEWKARQK